MYFGGKDMYFGGKHIIIKHKGKEAIMKLILTMQDISEIKQYIQTKSIPDGLSPNQKQAFVLKAQKFIIINGDVYGVENGNNLLAVANDDNVKLANVLQLLHTSSHRGMKAMYMAYKQKYVGIQRNKIDEYVRNCIICQRNIPLKRCEAITPIVASRRWERLIIDYIDLRKYSHVNSGFGWILNVIDSYSKFIYVLPTRSKEASEVYNFLLKLIRVEGAPEIIHTDNGREFVNSQISGLCDKYHIRHLKGRPRHPQSQGQVERANQTICRKLAKTMQSAQTERWVDCIDDVIAEYNLSWNRAINSTPMQILRGRRGFNNPIEHETVENDNEEDKFKDDASISFDDDNLNILESSEFNENKLLNNEPSNHEEDREELFVNEDMGLQEYRPRYIARMQQDADVHYREYQFECGDEVIVKRDYDNNTIHRREKLCDFYEEGTWTVVEKASSNSYLIELGGERKVVHKNQLKKINCNNSN